MAHANLHVDSYRPIIEHDSIGKEQQEHHLLHAPQKVYKVLTPEQVEFYDKNGYLIVRNCISQAEIQRYKRRFLEVVQGKRIPVEMEIARDVTAVGRQITKETDILRLQDVHTDPIYYSYCENPNVVDIVNDLIGTPGSCLMAMQLMFINKPPDSGKLTSRQPMHQDTPYFPIRPLKNMCCAWTAVDKMTLENGCLAIEPGSHKLGTLEHDFPEWQGVNRNYFGVKEYDPESKTRMHVELNPGDSIFFHMNIIHGSGVNRSQNCRKAITCHFANGSVCRYIEPEDDNQRRVASAILGATRKRCHRLGLKYDERQTLGDYFRRKARPVKRRRANL